MKIMIDLDGPCYEFVRTARYMLNTYGGRELPEVDSFWHHPYPSQLTKDDWHWLFSEGVKLGLFRYGHMVTGTRVALDQLARDGHMLGIITSRPEQAEQDTRDWVNLFFKDIPLRAGIHFTEDKHDIPGDILIDDMWENCVAWTERAPLTQVNRASLLFDRPWNHKTGAWGDEYRQSHQAMYRVRGWKEVVEWIQRRQTAITETSKRSSSESSRFYSPLVAQMEQSSERQELSRPGGGTPRTRLRSGLTFDGMRWESSRTRRVGRIPMLTRLGVS